MPNQNESRKFSGLRTNFRRFGNSLGKGLALDPGSVFIRPTSGEMPEWPKGAVC